MSLFNKKDKLEVAEWFVDLTGIFCQYEFFTKELWRKVDGFKRVDKAEVLVAFQHYWFHHKFGMYTSSCGMSWFVETDKDGYETYIKRFQPVIDAYEAWKLRQR